MWLEVGSFRDAVGVEVKISKSNESPLIFIDWTR